MEAVQSASTSIAEAEAMMTGKPLQGKCSWAHKVSIYVVQKPTSLYTHDYIYRYRKVLMHLYLPQVMLDTYRFKWPR